MISIDKSFVEEEEEDDDNELTNTPQKVTFKKENKPFLPEIKQNNSISLQCKKKKWSLLRFILDLNKQKDNVKGKILQSLMKKNDNFLKENNYNKWYMPADKRFVQRLGDKIMEAQKSPLKNNGYYKNMDF